MKPTTLQQKIVFSAKVFACILILGILSWLSFMPPTAVQTASAATATLSVTVIQLEPNIDATAPYEVGKNVPISGSSNNVDTVEVYLDVNENGVLDAGDILLDGNVDVLGDGSLSGSVNLPDRINGDELENGKEYQLIVQGHTANNNGGQYDEYVYDTVVVKYVVGPTVDCIHNTDNNCSILPGGDKPAFGGVDGGTEIIIDGENLGDLDKGDEVVVIIGGQECKIVSVAPDRIVCIVPPAKDGKAGPVDVTVCVNGLCFEVKDGFLYVALPETPATGLSGAGLFRVGNSVVTVRDIVLWVGLAVILAVMIMLIVIVKSSKKSTHYSASRKRR